LLIDRDNKQACLFTGDTVFLNEVGRPDLAAWPGLTLKDSSEMLFNSLQELKKLDDDVKVYPGHGAGSACGKNIGAGSYCTLGIQKKNNYGLKTVDKE
jgi:hydroxyacylglutathione hydrolase